MSDRENLPTDLFDLICELDDRADLLRSWGYEVEATALAQVSLDLKGYVVISLPSSEERP